MRFLSVTIYWKAFPEHSKTKTTRIILSRLRVNVTGFCLACTLALTEAELFAGMFSAVSGDKGMFFKNGAFILGILDDLGYCVSYDSSVSHEHWQKTL